MEDPIATPHLEIKKMVVDPDHTKRTIVYLIDQLFRISKQQRNIEWCLVTIKNGKEHIIQQPIIPTADLAPGYIWHIYFHRSKLIRQHKWAF